MKKIIATAAVLILTISNLSAQTKSSGKDRMVFVQFKNRIFCRVELNTTKNKDFIFNLCDSSEIVKSKTIKDNTLSITGYMIELKSGDIIEIKNVLGKDTTSRFLRKTQSGTFEIY